MKIHVIIDASGKIIGTARLPQSEGSGPGAPTIDAGPNGRVHEIELAKELESEKDPERLHAALAKHIAKSA
jgi:hypothetical protein